MSDRKFNHNITFAEGGKGRYQLACESMGRLTFRKKIDAWLATPDRLVSNEPLRMEGTDSKGQTFSFHVTVVKEGAPATVEIGA